MLSESVGSMSHQGDSAVEEGTKAVLWRGHTEVSYCKAKLRKNHSAHISLPFKYSLKNILV